MIPGLNHKYRNIVEMSNVEALKLELLKSMDALIQEKIAPKNSVPHRKLEAFYNLPKHPNVEHSPTVHMKNFKGVVNTFVKPGQVLWTNVRLPPFEYVVFIKPILSEFKHNNGFATNFYEQLSCIFVTNFGRCFESPNKIFVNMCPYESAGWIVQPQPVDAPVMTYQMPLFFLSALESIEFKDSKRLQELNERFYREIGQFEEFLTDELRINSESLVQKVGELRSQNGTLQSDNKNKDDTIKEQRRQILHLQGQMNSLQSVKQSLETKVNGLDIELRLAKVSVNELKQELKDKEEAYKKTLKEKDDLLADFLAYERIKQRQNMC
jgi:hypothetical protein